jgi:hypothetical protein
MTSVKIGDQVCAIITKKGSDPFRDAYLAKVIGFYKDGRVKVKLITGAVKALSPKNLTLA